MSESESMSVYVYKQAHRTRRSSRSDDKMARADRQKFSKVNVLVHCAAVNSLYTDFQNFC